MNAVISGRAGVAILIEKDHFFSIDVNEPDQKIPRRPDEVRFLLGEARDLRFVEDVSLDEVQRRLEEETSADEALHLALILLDAEHTDDLREEAATVLETLLASEAVAAQLEGVLYARPMPAAMDTKGAVALGRRVAAEAVVALVEGLMALQPVVERVWVAWDTIPTAVFGGADDREQALAEMVRGRLFRDLVKTRLERTSVDGLVAVALQSPSVRALRNHREIVSRWVAPLWQAKVERMIVTSEEAKLEIDAAPAQERSGPKHPPPFNRAEAFENVQNRKQAIVRAMDHGDLAQAQRLIHDLVAYQQTHGGPSYTSKSLCALAIEAQRRNLFALQLDLTQRSTLLQPNDAWSFAQHGKALLNMRDLSGALEAYDRSLDLGEAVVAKTGRAEVLKALGRLDDALSAYDKALREHPDNVVAKNGRAEVLKALGRLDDALTAYDEALREHPDNVVAKNGRAEVLKALGRLDDALTAYDKALREHPDNVVAKNGRAEVLKALGRLDDALSAYDKALHEHPADVVAKTGRAEVLKALGRLDDALTAYDKALREHPADVVAKNGRAEVLKALGRLDDALTAYDKALREHPADVVAKNGRAEVLKALGRLDDALTAYDKALREHPADVVAKNGRACILAALGRPQEALEQLPSSAPVTRHDWIGYHVRGMILLRTGQTDAAIAIFEHGVKDTTWQVDRDYFRNALAVARLRRRQYAAAIAQLELVKLPLLQEPANMLRVHAFGMQGQADQAAEAYQRLSPVTPPLGRELREELRRRFIAREAPQHDEDWLIQQEIDYLLAAA